MIDKNTTNKTFWVHWKMSSEEIMEITNKVVEKSIRVNNHLVKFDLDSNENLNLFLSKLSDDITEFQIFHSVCSFLQFISPDEKIRKASFNADLLLSKYINELNLRKDLYEKICEVKKRMEKKGLLSQIDKKFLDKLIVGYERNGINLNQDKKETLLRIKHEISKLENTIIKCINENENKQIELTETELTGVPNNIKNTFNKSSENYKIQMNKINYNMCMKYVIDQNTRQKLEELFSNIYDDIITHIVKLIVLRDKHAKLLTYNCHSDYKAFDQMTKNSDNIKNFLTELLVKLDGRYKKEIDTVHRIMSDLNHKSEKINSFDILYYTTKWKQEYGLNDNVLKEYFELSSVVNRIFKIYETLFAIKFSKINKPFTWHQNVIMYSITSNSSKDIIGYLYLDLYSRNGKYKQTRCFCLQPACVFPHNSGKYQIPIMALVSSFKNCDSTLLNYLEVISLFHELGHVMHHIFGKSTYILFSGTNVEDDFIETPAQILDLICWNRDVIKRLSSHYKSGESLPENIINKLIKMKNIDIGLNYKRQILISLFDQLIYSSEKFISSCENLLKLGDYKQLKSLLSGLFYKLHSQIMIDVNNDPKYKISLDCSRSILPYEWINTLFGSDSQYYCSIWSRVLSSDLFNEKIKDKQLDEKIGSELKKHILTHGGSKDAYDMICSYINRKPAIDGFISMHELDTEIEYSFFLNTDYFKNKYSQNSAKLIDKKINTVNQNDNFNDSISNRFSEINESVFEVTESENCDNDVTYLKNKFKKIDYN